MACNTCGNTTSNPCACQDTSLTLPSNCQYTDESCIGKETCADIQCEECVSWCRCTPYDKDNYPYTDFFYMKNANSDTIWVKCGERLDMTLQKMTLFMTKPTTWKHHIPLFYHGKVTTDSIELFWDGVPTANDPVSGAVDLTGIQIWQRNVTAAGPWVQANTQLLTTAPYYEAALATGTTKNFVAGGLNPNSVWEFHLKSTIAGPVTEQASVTIRAKTLAP